MSVAIRAETHKTESGHIFQTVTITSDGHTIAHKQASISPGDKDPGIAEVATQALEQIAVAWNEAKQKLTSMQLLVQRKPNDGPYR